MLLQQCLGKTFSRLPLLGNELCADHLVFMLITPFYASLEVDERGLYNDYTEENF